MYMYYSRTHLCTSSVPLLDGVGSIRINASSVFRIVQACTRSQHAWEPSPRVTSLARLTDLAGLDLQQASNIRVAVRAGPTLKSIRRSSRLSAPPRLILPSQRAALQFTTRSYRDQ